MYHPGFLALVANGTSIYTLTNLDQWDQKFGVKIVINSI